MELHGEFDRSFQQFGRKMSDDQLLFLALGSDVMILHTSYSNGTGAHKKCAVQVHNHKYLAVLTTSSGLV